MAKNDHGWCPLHGIGYNRSLDRTCPQCQVHRIAPPEQLDFDTEEQKPRDKAGVLLNPVTLQPVA